jgi:hypothetical protein
MLSTIGAKISEVELDGGPITSMSALGHKRAFAVLSSCPLYRRKRTFVEGVGMFA